VHADQQHLRTSAGPLRAWPTPPPVLIMIVTGLRFGVVTSWG
jgi:hypothetical protein